MVLVAIGPRRVREAAEERRFPWLALMAAAGPLLLAGLVVTAIQMAHAKLFQGLAATDPGERLSLILASLDGSMNARSLGVFMFCPALVLGTVAASLHASSALGLPVRSCVATSVVFMVAGVVPFLVGAWRYTIAATHTLAGVAGIYPELKALMVNKGFEEARFFLEAGAAVGTVGFVVAFVIGIVLARKDRDLARAANGRWWPIPVCLAGAAILYFMAEPMRAENNMPWPPSVCAALTVNASRTPEIEGPDTVPPAEVVTLSNTALLGNAAPRDIERWEETLVVMRRNYELLRAGEPPDENLVVVCDPDTRTERIVEILKVAQRTHYRRPAFAFGKATSIERPVLGKMRRWQWTAAKALIPGMGPEAPTPSVALNVADYPTCDGLARAVAAVRRTGMYPELAF